MLAARQSHFAARAFALALGLGLLGGCYKSLDVPNIPCDMNNQTSCPKGYVCTLISAGQAFCRRPTDGGADAPMASSEAGGSLDSGGGGEVPGKGLDGPAIDGSGGTTGEAGGGSGLDAALDSPGGTLPDVPLGGEVGKVDAPSGAGGAGGVDGPGNQVTEAGQDLPLGTATGGNSGSGGVSGAGGGAGTGVGGGAGGVAGTGGGGTTTGTGGALALGSPCASGTDCSSAICADGVCCDQTCGGCNACTQIMTGKSDGACAPVLAGADPHTTCTDETATNQCGNDGFCDGKGACRKVGTSHVCTPSSCNGFLFTPTSTCDGLGSCSPVSSTDCGVSPCSITDGCQTTCSSDTNCVGSSYCDTSTSTCKAKKIDGDPCLAGNECSSTYCIDGVCCHTDCTGCFACAATLTGQASGTCSPATLHTDPHLVCDVGTAPCGQDGTCDGTGACWVAPATTACGNESCSGSTHTPAAFCTGTGTCAPVTSSACPNNLICGTTQCKSGCATNADCVLGYACPTGGGTACGIACGDGTVNGTEQCDDGNTAAGDGCNGSCQKEAGWTCTGSGPGSCTPTCGDGVRVGTEACDEGNTVTTDGCNACQLSPGWACEGSPSVCLQVIYVNAAASGANDGTSWANAYTSLTAALGAATSGKQIWIAQGTYKPSSTGDRTQTFALVDGVPLYGGFIGGQAEDRSARNWQTHATILSGDLNSNDQANFTNNAENSYQVLTAIVGGITLDGLTIRGGNANGGTLDMGQGGGLYAGSGIATVTIQDCLFQANSATFYGGAASFQDPAAVIIRDSVFRNNSAGTGGGAVQMGRNGRIERCAFEQNQSVTSGSGLRIASIGTGTVDILGTTFLANSGSGAVYFIGNNGTLNVVNSVFDSNTCDIEDAAAVHASAGGGTVNFVNTSFLRNISAGFSVLDANTADVYFLNVTVAGGTSVRNPILIGSYAKIYAYNSIFRDSYSGAQISGSRTIAYCNLLSLMTDTGNTTADPLLDANGVPASNSPAINAGNNSYLPTDVADVDGDGNTSETLPLDLAGNARIQGGTVDMGAYEVQ